MRRFVDQRNASGSPGDVRAFFQLLRLEPIHWQSLYLHLIQIHSRNRCEYCESKFSSCQPVAHLPRVRADDDIGFQKNTPDKLRAEALRMIKKPHCIARSAKCWIIGNDLAFPLRVE